MKRVFVTGASGFIGSHLVRSFSSGYGYEVGGLIHTIDTSRRDLQGTFDKCKWLIADIRDFQAIKEFLVRWQPEYVIHLAASAIVKTAYLDPIGTFDVNVMGTVKLLQACKDAGVKRVLVQSTDKVYGNQEGATVASPLYATEIYSASKIGADVAARMFQELDVVITRMANVYGYDLNDRIIPNTIRACLRGESPVIYEGDKSVRQYVYVQDAVDALRYCVERGGEKIYNISTPHQLRQERVVKTILEHFPNIKPNYVKRAKGYQEIMQQSIVCNLSEWEPKWNFNDGIKQTITDFRKFGGVYSGTAGTPASMRSSVGVRV